MSTIAALGAFFVTCWQSLAQMQHRYGTLADAVLSGHRTKCFFAGVDDLATARYVSSLLGHEHVRRRSWSKDTPRLFGNGGAGRQSVSETDQREEFAPANALREMYPGEAVLLHGTLPPIHLEAVRWWKERELAAVVKLDSDGNPTAPPNLLTCPLTGIDSGDNDQILDERTFQSAIAELPKLRNAKSPAASGDEPSTGVAARTALADKPLQSVGRCDACGELILEGEAQPDHRGDRAVLRCVPSCTLRRAMRSGTCQ